MTRRRAPGRPATGALRTFGDAASKRNSDFAAWERFCGIHTVVQGRALLGVDYRTYKNYQIAKKLPRPALLAMQAIAQRLPPWGEDY